MGMDMQRAYFWNTDDSGCWHEIASDTPSFDDTTEWDLGLVAVEYLWRLFMLWQQMLFKVEHSRQHSSISNLDVE